MAAANTTGNRQAWSAVEAGNIPGGGIGGWTSIKNIYGRVVSVHR